MDSTLKIGLESSTGKSVIKIITPESNLKPTQVSRVTPINPADVDKFYDEDDVRDQLVREFLHHPLYSEPYEYYQKGCSFQLHGTDKRLITIEPIKEENLFYRFRHSLLNRFVPYETLVDMNRRKLIMETAKAELLKGDKASLEEVKLTGHKYSVAEDVAIKINEFFDMIENLEYATDEQRYP